MTDYPAVSGTYLGMRQGITWIGYLEYLAVCGIQVFGI
jgi:hypothetical protein